MSADVRSIAAVIDWHAALTNYGDGLSEALAGVGEYRPARAGRVAIGLFEGAAGAAEAVRVLDAAGIAIEHMELTTPTLDDVFAEATGRRLEGAEEATP